MTFFSKILIIASLFGLITAITVMMPSPISENIDNAIVYILSYLNYLGYFVDVNAIFMCIGVVGNFIFASILFLTLVWFFRLGK